MIGTRSMQRLLFVGSTAAVFLLSAAASAQDNTAAQGNTGTQGNTGSAKMAKGSSKHPSDAQILGILSAANTTEVDAANLAQTKATNDNVKNFAADMIKDHTAMNDEGNNLASKIGVSPEESPTSTKIKNDAQKAMTKLSGLSGAAFDKAYVDDQVKDHTMVLNMITHTLLPNAKNPQLKSMVKTAKTKIAQHLKHAKQVQAMLRKGGKNAAMGRTP